MLNGRVDGHELYHLPELKCERFVEPFSVSLSSGRLRESPISGLGHSIPASGSAAISTINPQFN